MDPTQRVRKYLRIDLGLCPLCGVIIADDRIQNTFQMHFIHHDIIACECGRGLILATWHMDLTQWARDYS